MSAAKASDLQAPASAQPLQPGYPRTARLPELDGLRGIAITLVLLFHYVVLVADLPVVELRRALALFRLGWTGVDLFFVLSGFLIGGILIDSRSSPRYFRTFYTRRFCRIFPLYYCFLLLFVFLASLGPTRIVNFEWLFGQAFPLASYATFTQNVNMAIEQRWGPNWTSITWSLAIEEQFYLVLPLVVRAVHPHRLPHLVVLWVLSAPVLRIVLYALDLHYAHAAYALMPARADALGMGMLAALAVRDSRVYGRLLRSRTALYAGAAVLGLGMMALTVLRPNPKSLLLNSVGYTWIALFYASLLLIVVTDRNGWAARVCRWRALLYMGTVSYFVYLFHQSASGLCHGLLRGGEPALRGLADLGTALVALAVVLLLARLSWKHFERPLIRRGHLSKY